MPRKAQGWITFQATEAEQQILERICQQTQRTKTEILREMIRNMGTESTAITAVPTEATPNEADQQSTVDVIPQSLDISARNVLKATVKQVVKDSVNAEITLSIAPDVEFVSVITRSSADKLKLKKGKIVFAVVKSHNVMIATLK